MNGTCRNGTFTPLGSQAWSVSWKQTGQEHSASPTADVQGWGTLFPHSYRCLHPEIKDKVHSPFPSKPKQSRIFSVLKGDSLSGPLVSEQHQSLLHPGTLASRHLSLMVHTSVSAVSGMACRRLSISWRKSSIFFFLVSFNVTSFRSSSICRGNGEHQKQLPHWNCSPPLPMDNPASNLESN